MVCPCSDCARFGTDTTKTAFIPQGKAIGQYNMYKVNRQIVGNVPGMPYGSVR
ncbi:MAG: hypothetical protein OHK0029_12670 [Armatimonadaceae bacterium]